jgi:hypothetical protein
LIRPTDAAGAEIEIESVRLIFRREHLANIPSGVSWQGFQNIFRETLVSRSPEQLTYHLRLPQQPWLDLSVATARDGPVTFKIAVQAEDHKEQLLLKQTVTTSHRWEPAPVPLEEFGGQQVTISLSAEAEEEGVLAFWGAPVIRDRLPGVAQPGSLETPQGVILIVGDTLRRDHLSPYGYDRSTAPYLSRMASEGVLFRDGQSQGSWTKVSVPSILTSLYPSTHGISDVMHRIPASITTLAEIYQQAEQPPPGR